MASVRKEKDKTPVTIVTGFLGAGKTTLLNHILKEKHNTGIAVIENEFGAVDIDRELVAANLIEKEDLVSLSSGCVCCSLRKDIVRALAEIERNGATREKRIEAVILETTGLADPGPVAFTFFSNPWIASRFRLDGIICVVDARHMLQHLNDEGAQGTINEVLQQIAFADLVLLNKVDLVSEDVAKDVYATIRHVNKTAQVIRCQLNSETFRPPVDQLLGTNLFSLNRILKVDPALMDEALDSADDPEFDPTAPIPTTSARTQAAPAIHLNAPGPCPEEPAADGEAGANRKRSHDAAGCSSDQATAPPDPGSAALLSAPKRRKRLHDMCSVASIAIVAHGMLDEYRFNMFMRDLLAEKAKDIFRCKGVLSIQGCGSTKFIFQGVHETICYGPAERPWAEGEERLNQIVFIGRGLDRKAITESLRTCVWIPLPTGWVEFKDKRTNQPYYCNPDTKEKSWTRPLSAPAHVEVTPLLVSGTRGPAGSGGIPGAEGPTRSEPTSSAPQAVH